MSCQWHRRTSYALHWLFVQTTSFPRMFCSLAECVGFFRHNDELIRQLDDRIIQLLSPPGASSTSKLFSSSGKYCDRSTRHKTIRPFLSLACGKPTQTTSLFNSATLFELISFFPCCHLTPGGSFLQTVFTPFTPFFSLPRSFWGEFFRTRNGNFPSARFKPFLDRVSAAANQSKVDCELLKRTSNRTWK